MERILIIDDDPGIRSSLRRTLEEAGFDVDEAENGAAGLRAYSARRPDVVICDIFMPVKEGLETIHELHDADPAAPIVAISGGALLTSVDPLPVAAALGACRVLRKPFKMEEFLTTVREILAASPQPLAVPTQ